METDRPRHTPLNPLRPRLARAAAPALGLLALTLLAYLPALHGDFLWDDDAHFSQNALMAGSLADLWRGNVHYYPLTSTSFWLMLRAFGPDPFPFHLLNVLLHTLNALLLVRLLGRLRVPGAWLAGALFALHPVAVQSVAWMTELKNGQSGFFYLLALLAWERFDRRGGAGWYGAALAAFAAAVLSKTSTVILPCLLVLMHWWRARPWSARAVAGWLPFFGVSVLASLYTIHAQGVMSIGAEWALTPAERLLIAGRVPWFYLGKLFWPAGLAFVYPRWTLDAQALGQWLWPLATVALTGVLWAGRRWGPRPLLAWLYFLVTLLPVSGFFRIYYHRYTFVADHWVYLGSMGIAAGVAAGLVRLTRRAPLRLRAAGSALLLGMLTWLTFQQAFVYRDGEMLWAATLVRNPEAEIVYNGLGAWYAEHGRLAEAEAVLREGWRRHPGDPRIATILGAVLLGQHRAGEAEPLLRQALDREPDDPEILNNLGIARFQQGRLEEAIALYRQSIAADPDLLETWINLAGALDGAGRRDEAQAALDEALRRYPGVPLLLRARALLDAG